MTTEERKKLILKERTKYLEEYPLKIRTPGEKHKVFKVPVEYLYYNNLNGRISSITESWKAEGENIQVASTDYLIRIEKILWNSAERENIKTLKDLKNNGQQRPGIITSDGRVIDGNRRLMLLNRLYRETGKKDYGFFHAIILEDNLSEKEIMRLELNIQFGEDEKVDYNPIEKYIMVNRRINEGFTPKDIEEDTNGRYKASQIKEFNEIFELMKEYLNYISRPRNFELLDFRKVEDPLITLYNQLKKLKSNKHSSQSKWELTQNDISDVKNIYFDLVRLQPIENGKEFRPLIQSEKKRPFTVLEDKETWKDFTNKHYEITENIDDDYDSEFQIINSHPEKRNLPVIEKVKQVENQLKKKYQKDLSKNVIESIRRVESFKENNTLINDLKDVFGKLKKIKSKISDEDMFVSEISILLDGIKKIVSDI
jgi:hypothetical protein